MCSGRGSTGSLRDANGDDLGPGTKIEAYIGSTLCGAFSVPPVKMVFDETEGSYQINVASPTVIPACAKDGDGLVPDQRRRYGDHGIARPGG